MIPKDELRHLAVSIMDANTAAGDGRVNAGCQLLLSGLQRAQNAAAQGEPWAAELEEHYRRAIANYTGRSHEDDESADEPQPARRRSRR